MPVSKATRLNKSLYGQKHFLYGKLSKKVIAKRLQQANGMPVLEMFTISKFLMQFGANNIGVSPGQLMQETRLNITGKKGKAAGIVFTPVN